MSELLLEIGCEELPATFVERAYIQLHNLVAKLLEETFGQPFQGLSCGTPRRLIVCFQEVPAMQADSVKEIRGPALKAAFNENGEPQGPLIGFCKSNNVSLESVIKREGYAWVNRSSEGRPTKDILTEELPKLIASLTFEKSMRWGRSRGRFARPIRWILAILGGEIIPFTLEGVHSGNQSRGHRFYSPNSFEVTDFNFLESELRNRKVEVWSNKRKESIILQAKQLSEKNCGGQPEMLEGLINENVFLTEWPNAVCGSFPEAHLSLPSPVLTTSMAKHIKMFPVRDQNGELLNRFIFIRNGGMDDEVRRGNEWVLNARLDDAQFFFKEDQKYSLAEFLDQTSGIVFQAQLGSVRDRSERLHDLCTFVAEMMHVESHEVDHAARAGLYAKADLSTGLVSEFASLQGIIGGIYGKRDGFSQETSHAISTQYDYSLNIPIKDSNQRIGIVLAVADALDKLAGYLGIGLAPTGSSDPYGLRRSATCLIESSWGWPLSIPGYQQAFIRAIELYMHQGVPLDGEKALRSLNELMVNRYSAMLSNERYDIVEAAVMSTILGRALDPRMVRTRAELMKSVVQNPGMVQTASRPINLVESAIKKGFQMDDPNYFDHLDSPEGLDLGHCNRNVYQKISEKLPISDVESILFEIKTLMPKIDLFMDTTMILIDDIKVRTARLALLRDVCQTLQLTGDFTKLVVEKP